MSHSPLEYLRHILDEARYLVGLLPGLDKARFMEDETFKRAVVRSLEITGEAAKKVPDEYRNRPPEFSGAHLSGSSYSTRRCC